MASELSIYFEYFVKLSPWLFVAYYAIVQKSKNEQLMKTNRDRLEQLSDAHRKSFDKIMSEIGLIKDNQSQSRRETDKFLTLSEIRSEVRSEIAKMPHTCKFGNAVPESSTSVKLLASEIKGINDDLKPLQDLPAQVSKIDGTLDAILTMLQKGDTRK